MSVDHLASDVAAQAAVIGEWVGQSTPPEVRDRRLWLEIMLLSTRHGHSPLDALQFATVVDVGAQGRRDPDLWVEAMRRAIREGHGVDEALAYADGVEQSVAPAAGEEPGPRPEGHRNDDAELVAVVGA